jgi:hypothetical protein
MAVMLHEIQQHWTALSPLMSIRNQHDLVV